MKRKVPTKRIFIVLIVMLIAITAVVGTASAVTDRIKDGNFYQGTTYWQYVDYPSSSTNMSEVDFNSGYASVYLNPAQDYESEAYIYQDSVDLTDVDYITFEMKQTANSNTNYKLVVEVWVNYIKIWTNPYTVPRSDYFDFSVEIPSTLKSTDLSNSNVLIKFDYDLSSVSRYYIQSTTVSIKEVSALPSKWQPEITSVDSYTWNGYNLYNGGYGMNLSMSSSGWVYGSFSSTDFDLGGISASSCQLQVDFDGNGTADDSGYYISDSSFSGSTSYNAVGVYTPQIRIYNGYYYSDWYQLPLTVVARLQIDTAGAVISGSDGYVSISASDIFTPASDWYYTYRWDFNYPNGTGSYIRTLTDASLTFSYTQVSAPKAQYSIGLSATASNNTYSVTIPTIPFTNAIDTRSNSVTFGATTYTSGDNMSVTWDYSAWYNLYPSDTIQLRIYHSDDSGIRVSRYEPVYTYQLSSTSGTKSDIVAPSSPDYYSAYLWDLTKNQEIDNAYTSSPASVSGVTNLTVQLLADSITYTDSTTVTLYVGQTTGTRYERSGFTNPVTNITTGSVTFTDIPYGGANSYYTITAETVGYSTLTATVMLPVDDNILRMDFVNGTSEGSYSGGSVTAYASSFVTIRVIDEGTGAYQSGVSVSIEAKQATNPAEWFVNLFGSAWGSTIEGTVQSGITDSNGGVTFAVFPNYRYRVDLAYNNRTWQYTFQPSTVTTEEIIRLDITESITGKDKTDIITMDVSSSMDDNKGYITVNFKDKTTKTTMLSIAVYQYTDGEASLATLVGTDNPIIITESSYGGKIGEYTQGLTINRASGKEFVVSLECVSETFGTNIPDDVIKRSKTVEFNGIRIPIGNIPDGLYIVICFVVLLMLGAVGTQVTSRFYAIVVAVVGIFMLWAGWMSALGTVGEIACIVAFILAILYYIATGNQPQ